MSTHTSSEIDAHAHTNVHIHVYLYVYTQPLLTQSDGTAEYINISAEG